jgi:SAM-dependent methyltransferase
MKETFPVKRLADGRALLNLGSSARVAQGWNNVDSSWLLRLARRPRLATALHWAGIVSDYRYERLRQLDRDVVCWDLRRGIPYPDSTFDILYQSHVLEHIEREAAHGFLRECRRVLKPGCVLRVVVPDLEKLVRTYLAVMNRPLDPARPDEHDAAVDEIFDQMVRRVPKIRAQRPPVVQLLESVFVGDTARSGELHRWMYDRFSLPRLLTGSGFDEVLVVDESTSRVPAWESFRLDTESDGSAYKPDSLYVEARRPPE